MVLLGKILILQGVGHQISCLGVCYANDPPKRGERRLVHGFFTTDVCGLMRSGVPAAFREGVWCAGCFVCVCVRVRVCVCVCVYVCVCACVLRTVMTALV